MCSSHLKGSWTDVKEEDVDLKVIEGGFINRNFLCINKKCNEKVLIRLYGGKMVTPDSENVKILRSSGREGEVLVTYLAAIKGIAPQVLGIFEGGRIEEYVDGIHSLSSEDYQDKETMTSFAEKLARLHSMTDTPLDKNPKDFIGIIRGNFTKKWNGFRNFILKRRVPKEMEDMVKIAAETDFFKIIDFYEQFLPTIKTKVVFSHNDMNPGNCLVNGSKEGNARTTVIDFEFSGYNYRGCDIGHHFICRTNGKQDQVLPYPSEEERRFFIRSYLQEMRKLSDSFNDDSINTEDNLLLEAEFFGSLYNFFMVACMVNDKEQFERTETEFNPGVTLGRFVQHFIKNKERILDLKARVQCNK